MEQQCYSTKCKSECIPLPYICNTWEIQFYNFCMITPRQKRREVPTHKEEAHLSAWEEAYFLSRLACLWSLCASFSETCNTNVVTDILHSHKNSYFRPNNWQIKTKDQLTKRKMNIQQSNVIVCSTVISLPAASFEDERRVALCIASLLCITKCCKLWVVC